MSSLHTLLLQVAITVAAVGALQCTAPSDASQNSAPDAADAKDADDAADAKDADDAADAKDAAGAKDASEGGASCEPSQDGGPLIRQFTIDYSMKSGLGECQNGNCDGGTCYHLSKELSVCDQAQPDPYTGDCSGPNYLYYECGCYGQTCTGGRVCAALEHTCSCPIYIDSRCVEPACTSAADCPAGTVCVPASMIAGARCVEARCSRDSDCTGGCAGRCAALYFPPLQSGEWKFLGMFCTYVDGPGERACPDAHGLPNKSYYYCP